MGGLGIMILDSMTFMITDRCTAACEICCLSCSPRNSKCLDKETIKDYLRQLAAENPGAQAAFTGGEALACREMLLECMHYAKSLGLGSTLISNCSFATSAAAAKEVVGQLKEAGLSSMAVSCDEYHRRFVPAQNVKYALLALASSGVKAKIRMMETRDSGDIAKTIALLRPECYGAEITTYPIFPAGSAIASLPEEKFVRVIKADEAICPFDKSITATFDGDLIFCCSQFSFDLPVVKLGRFGKNTLAEAKMNISRNDFLYVLLKNGLGWYARLARQRGFDVAEKYTSPCHLCRELLGNSDFMKQAVPFVSEEADRLRLEKFFG